MHLEEGLLPGFHSNGVGARAQAVCAFAGEAGWEIVSPPFPFTPKASALRGVCSQYIPLYHSLAFLWPYSLWMKKEKVQMFSLSEPVHWIIHTKRFLLEEGQGGEGVFHRLAILQTPVRLWEGNPWSGWGMVAARCALEFICISQKLTLCLCSLQLGHELNLFQLSVPALHYWLFTDCGQSGSHMQKKYERKLPPMAAFKTGKHMVENGFTHHCKTQSTKAGAWPYRLSISCFLQTLAIRLFLICRHLCLVRAQTSKPAKSSFSFSLLLFFPSTLPSFLSPFLSFSSLPLSLPSFLSFSFFLFFFLMKHCDGER